MTKKAGLCAVTALLLAGVAAAQQSRGIAWSSEPAQDVLARAKRDGKPAVVYFHAEWCGLSRELNGGAFRDEQVIAATAGYMLVAVDCTERTNMALARSKFDVRGVPTVLFYNSSGERVDEVVGSAGAEVFVRKLTRAGEGVRAKGSQEPRDGKWRDTHRVYLRNGNVVDGRLDEFTTEAITIEYEPGVTTQIKTETALRVELITIRAMGKPVEHVEPVTPFKDEKFELRPTGARRTTMVELKPTDARVKSAVEDILSRLENADDKRIEILRGEALTLGEPGANYLIWRMQTLDDKRTGFALSVLASMKEIDIVAGLRDLLTWPRPDIRAAAATILADRGDTRSVANIAKLLRDDVPAVRAAAANSMAALADASMLATLTEATLDNDKQPRQRARDACVTVAGRTKSEAELASRWMELLSRAPAPARADIVGGLAKLVTGSDKQVPRTEIREAVTEMLSEREAEVRAEAAIALGIMGSREALAAILERMSVEEDGYALGRMCEALAKIGDFAAVEPLIEHLKSENKDVVTAATRALRTLTKQNQLGSDYTAWKAWFDNSK